MFRHVMTVLFLGAATLASAQPGRRVPTSIPTPIPSAVAAPAVETDMTGRIELATRIDTQSARVPLETQEKLATRFDAIVKEVDDHGAQIGDPALAERIAHEVGTDKKALGDEKIATGSTWGGLLVAHTLAANQPADPNATVANLLALHDAGMSWGKLAAGLGLDPEAAARAASGEAKVALGLARGDKR